MNFPFFMRYAFLEERGKLYIRIPKKVTGICIWWKLCLDVSNSNCFLITKESLQAERDFYVRDWMIENLDEILRQIRETEIYQEYKHKKVKEIL